MTTFRRFCEYVDAAHAMQPKVARGASYGEVVAGLADAGFAGATAGELEILARHFRGFTDTRRELSTLIGEVINMIRQYAIRPDAMTAYAIGPAVPADDVRGQTVLHDLRQFEVDLKEAARRTGKAVPPMTAYDTPTTADNAFAWAYALRANMLPIST